MAVEERADFGEKTDPAVKKVGKGGICGCPSVDSLHPGAHVGLGPRRGVWLKVWLRESTTGSDQ